MQTDSVLMRITHQSRQSYLMTPITDLIATAKAGRGKFSVLSDLDVGYLTFHAMTFIIRNMGGSVAGVEETRVKENLAEMVSVMAPDKGAKECAKAASLIIETVMNSANSYYPHRYRYYDGLDGEFKIVAVKLLELHLFDDQNYYRIGEQGFLVFRSMLEKSLDVQQEMNAYIIQVYMEQRDYLKASQLIDEGVETLIETQHRLLEVRRRIDHMVRIDYRQVKSECRLIHDRIDKALVKNKMTYQQIPPLANDGSESDQQLKVLDRRFLEFIEMFAKTVNMVEETQEHLEARLVARISQRGGNAMMDFSVYGHVLSPLLLKREGELGSVLDDLLCALFPARLRSIDSPYQLIKSQLTMLSEEDKPEEWQAERVEEEFELLEKGDPYFTKEEHNKGFRDLVLQALEDGDVRLSEMLTRYQEEFSHYQLKSFYLYLLGEYLNQTDVEFMVSKMDDLIMVTNVYEGNDLLVARIAEQEEVNHG